MRSFHRDVLDPYGALVRAWISTLYRPAKRDSGRNVRWIHLGNNFFFGTWASVGHACPCLFKARLWYQFGAIGASGGNHCLPCCRPTASQAVHASSCDRWACADKNRSRSRITSGPLLRASIFSKQPVRAARNTWSLFLDPAHSAPAPFGCLRRSGFLNFSSMHPQRPTGRHRE